MKKTFLLLCAVCTSVIVSGQLKVQPNGIFRTNNVLSGQTGYSGQSNVSFGFGALSNNSGNNNTATGYQALYSNTTGFRNIANGSYALYSNTTGYNNIANGSYALYSNTTGSSNIANGFDALYFNITGSSNVANGVSALYRNTGEYNTADGDRALTSNTTGNYNTANGSWALYDNTTGSFNTASGRTALFNNGTGSYNTAIGTSADVSANNLSNATAIGYNAKATANNQVRIGNSSVSSIGGYAGWSNISDGRTKKNIRADVPGLAFINRLQPVMYNFDLNALDDLLKSDDPRINRFDDSLRAAQTPEEKKIIAEAKANKEKIVYTGFIAQDVEKTAKSIGYDFSGVDAPENGKGAYGLRYAEFVVPLVKAVQELSEQVNELKAEIAELKKSNNTDVILKSAQPAQQGDDVFTQSNEDPAALYQNTPNPFTQSTEIRYYLPASVNMASLCIYDLNGKQLEQIRLTQRGAGSQIISGSKLPAGIYLYALIADGKEVDVKRMILTE